MKTIIKIVIAGIILMVLAIGGCAALVGGAANEIDKEITKTQNEHAITTEQFKKVQMGITLPALKKTLGEPDPEYTQTTEVEGMKSTCVYYNIKGGDLLDMYQFCFTNGVLEGKSKF